MAPMWRQVFKTFRWAEIRDKKVIGENIKCAKQGLCCQESGSPYLSLLLLHTEWPLVHTPAVDEDTEQWHSMLVAKTGK